MGMDSGLDAHHCDPYVFDIDHFEFLLKENSRRLFVQDDELQVKLIEVGVKDHIFTNLAALDTYLQSTKFNGTRIILIPQRYSWDRLTISEHGLRRLMQHFSVFPTFVDVLCAFGKQTAESGDSLGGSYSWNEGHVAEFCYLIKNVEKHGRNESDEPWSIRKLGLYHRRDQLSGDDTFIVLNPTISFQQRFKDAQARAGTVPTWQDIHLLAFSHSTWQWRWYLSFWESQLTQLISKAHVSRVEGRKKTDRMPVVTIEYGDFQDVQVIHDRMSMAKSIIGYNVHICDNMRKVLQRPQIDVLLQELKLQSTRVNGLLERTGNGARLMQDIISFRALDALKTSSENSNEMARLADLDSKNMVKLTTKSQKDAGTLKKITILTSIYLPASFASFLSMGYLKVNSSSQPASLNFSAEMWIFAVLTILLLGVTFGVWLYMDFPRRRPSQSHPAADEKV